MPAIIVHAEVHGGAELTSTGLAAVSKQSQTCWRMVEALWEAHIGLRPLVTAVPAAKLLQPWTACRMYRHSAIHNQSLSKLHRKSALNTHQTTYSLHTMIGRKLYGCYVAGQFQNATTRLQQCTMSLSSPTRSQRFNVLQNCA